MTPAMNSTRRLSARAVALIGTGAVVAYALLAAVQILVWNPQAAVPGVGLDQIYADVAATGESMAAGMVIAFLAVGPLLAIALLVGAWRRPEGRASVVGVPFLVLLALGAPAYFWANFGPGMALADTFFVSGGDHSAWSAPLYVTSGLAVLALVGHVVVEPLEPSVGTQKGGVRTSASAALCARVAWRLPVPEAQIRYCRTVARVACGFPVPGARTRS